LELRNLFIFGNNLEPRTEFYRYKLFYLVVSMLLSKLNKWIKSFKVKVTIKPEVKDILSVRCFKQQINLQ